MRILLCRFKQLYVLLFGLWLINFCACSSLKLENFEYQNEVDTDSRPIQKQDKRLFSVASAGVYADNMFDGARLNGFIKSSGYETYQVIIKPENKPINPSPWYAFRIWSDSKRTINLELHYPESKHRYTPKMSTDGQNWEIIPEEKIQANSDSSTVTVLLEIGPDKLWIAGQELHNSARVNKWCVQKGQNPQVEYFTIGKSKLARDLIGLDIGIGDKKGKDIIAILSRQHPPEVTGYLAMQAFVDAILADNSISNSFRRKYRVIVFPLINPDGVDMGHWRHNAGGIDLNRDWAYYRQPEVRQVAEYLVDECIKNGSQLILGLDFHSTYRDVFYTPDNTMDSQLDGFKEYWLSGIGMAMDNFKVNDAPGPATSPTSKSWFYNQFGAEGITFEIGDNTPREFIKKKGGIAAQEMMQLLIFR